jgi:hypothetical protein
MLIVPVQAVPSQTFSILLANQSCRINLADRQGRMFMDLLVNDALVVGGVLCQNENRIVRSLYFAFSGDFEFYDTQGDTDPVYTGLGSRYLLLYLSADELPAGQG